MLNRVQLAHELTTITKELFVDWSSHYAVATNAWQQLAQDPLIVHKAAAVEDPPWPVPRWHGQLNIAIPVHPSMTSYTVISVDGSQIYPDRHQGLSCFLVNVGSVVLSYGAHRLPVTLASRPYVFAGNEPGADTNELSTDFVNCRRHELELRDGLSLAAAIREKAHPDHLSLLLVDGSLIFWHLENGKGLKERFLDVYLILLLKFYQESIAMVGYISAPKSKELINIVRLWLCDFNVEHKHKYEQVNQLVDTAIVQSFVPPAHRTIVFENKSRISLSYPDPICPYFFYLNTGDEIGRVELPAWIARDEQLVNRIASLILDQCTKGRGYPLAIAEAHEQAVVKAADREFFYHLLRKMSIEHHQRMHASIKSQRKLRMSV